MTVFISSVWYSNLKFDNYLWLVKIQILCITQIAWFSILNDLNPVWLLFIPWFGYLVIQSLLNGLTLWYPGVFPPTLIAFEGHVHPIDPSFHMDGLGYQAPEVHEELLEASAVLHFSGPAKPWLEIGLPEVRGLWNKHVNTSNRFVRKCRVMGWREQSSLILALFSFWNRENTEQRARFGTRGKKVLPSVSGIALKLRTGNVFLVHNREKKNRWSYGIHYI